MSEFVSTAGRLGSSTAILAAALMLAGCDWQAQTSASTAASDSVAAVQTAVTTPDFSSNGVAWQGVNADDYTPVPGSPPLITNDPAHPRISNALARLTGGVPTYRISDLTNPNLKQWAKDVMKKDNDEVLAGKVAFTPRQSCVPAGVPNFNLLGGALQFLQTPEMVVMIIPNNKEVRHVYMDAPHSANPKPSWYGESVGHYEGDTLVIDTIGQNTKTFLDKFRTPHSENLHVVERWRMIDGGEGMEVHMTVDDPDTFYEPWQATRNYRRTQSTINELICAENVEHLHFFDFGMPEADKVDF